MGTNFFLYRHFDTCDHCARTDGPLHIGTLTPGWCFALHVDPEVGINSLEDWPPLFRSGSIHDENGKRYSAVEMIEIITCRTASGFLALPTSGHLRGPNGLHRHIIDPRSCVAHGEGPWDLMVGWFR